MVHQTVMVKEARSNFHDFVETKLYAMKMPQRVKWPLVLQEKANNGFGPRSDLLLPNSSRPVQRDMARWKKQRMRNARKPLG